MREEATKAAHGLGKRGAGDPPQVVNTPGSGAGNPQPRVYYVFAYKCWQAADSVKCVCDRESLEVSVPM